MSNSILKKYITILNEASSYNSLQDAGNDYSEGNTQIWYWKEDYGHEMMRGFAYLKENNKIPKPNALQLTHVLVGKIAETNPDTIYGLMQGEIWSPEGQARSLIQKLGVGHTSMSVGDIIVLGKKALMVDSQGFVDLNTGENSMLLNDIFESAPADQVKGDEKATPAGKDHPFKGRLVGEDDRPNDNFSPDDIKKLERTQDIATARKMAIELISMSSKRAMKPAKVEWFKRAVNSKKNVLDIVKLMYDLLLSGEGNKVIGTRSSTEPNSYRKAFGENDEMPSADPIDKITMDVPLFIRMLEFAREDANSDMDLHDLAERAIQMMKEHDYLCMDCYNELVGGEPGSEKPVKEAEIEVGVGYAIKLPSGQLAKASTGKTFWHSSPEGANKANQAWYGGEGKVVKVSLKPSQYSYNGHDVSEDKIKGADGKACWDGYRYNGTKNGKDSCVKSK